MIINFKCNSGKNQILSIGALLKKISYRKFLIYSLADRPSCLQVSIMLWKIAEAFAPFLLQKSYVLQSWGVYFVLTTSYQSYNYHHCDNGTVVPKMYAYS